MVVNMRLWLRSCAKIKIILSIICPLLLVFLFLPVSDLLAIQEIQESSVTGLGATKNVRAELIMPGGSGPFPGVLILHTAHGISKYDIAYARHLAQEGYACLVPYYFDAYKISKKTKILAMTVYAENILADFTAEIRYLKNQPKINKDRIGAVGFSMGGYWALVLAGMKKVQGGVSYYGGMNGGSKYSKVRYHFEDIFTKDSSPVLILHGKNDLLIKVKYLLSLANMLKKKSCVYEMNIYPNAGHNFDRGKSLDVPAANDSWKRTLGFLKKYLH